MVRKIILGSSLLLAGVLIFGCQGNENQAAEGDVAMKSIALFAPVISEKLDVMKTFSQDLHEGPHHDDYIAFMKKCGVTRIRCWLQEGPGHPISVIVYEGETPMEFLKQIGISQDPFAVWFRDRIMENNGMDLTQPPPGPLPALVTDAQTD